MAYDKNRVISNYYPSKLIAENTTLSPKNAGIILDIFSFFFKKEIINLGQVNILNFGQFVVKKKRSVNVKFTCSVFLKRILEKLEFNKASKFESCSEEYRNIIKNISKVLKIGTDDLEYVLSIFWYGLIESVIKEGQAKVKTFGTFKIKETVKQRKKIVFVPFLDFICELNHPTGKVKVGKRAGNILKLCGFEVYVTKE